VAAKSGGYHFRFDGSRWMDTRDPRELLAVLSDLITGQSGRAIVLS
jgi:CyaY protein